ncbi:MAG: hypothetical protein KME31_31140 [Tolypothrix carrinoi HA7290-LM1]|nr:hypothetical protein [Tolypothrix carrinoi HA7290-LM1]
MRGFPPVKERVRGQGGAVIELGRNYPMPIAQCPIPNSQFPIPNSQFPY